MARLLHSAIFFLSIFSPPISARERDIWSIGNVELRPNASPSPDLKFGFWRKLPIDCAKSKINTDGCAIPSSERISNRTCVGAVVQNNEWQMCPGVRNVQKGSVRWRLKKNSYKLVKASHAQLTIEVVRKEEIHEGNDAANPQQDGSSKPNSNKDSNSKDSNSKDSNSKDSNSKDGNSKDGNSKDSNSKDSNSKDSNSKDSNSKGGSRDSNHKDSDRKDSDRKSDGKKKDGSQNDSNSKSDRGNEGSKDSSKDGARKDNPPKEQSQGDILSKGRPDPKDTQPRPDRPRKDGPVMQIRAWNGTFEWDAKVSVQLDLTCSNGPAADGKSEVTCVSKGNLQEILEADSRFVSVKDFEKMYW